MPTEYRISPDRKLAFFHFSGQIDTQQCAQVFLDYTADHAFDPGYTMLTDAGSVTGIDANFIGILGRLKMMQATLARFEKPVQSIIHVRGDVAYGMARVLQQLAEPMVTIEFVITRDETAALALAGQPEPDLATLASALGLPVS